MSSSISDSSASQGKLLVHVAENGNSFELNCDETTLVEAVQRCIEPVTGINFNDQLLLCLDMKLEPQRPLSSYKLPSDDHEVFIFNKSRLQLNSQPPPPEQVETLEITEPPLPSFSHKPHPLDDASDPALKALPSYERQFRYHYRRGHAIYSHSQVEIEHCERLLREQKVQERAVEVARANLEHYFRVMQQSYLDFTKCYSQQHRWHSDLLMNFEKEIEKLRSCKLHFALQTETRKCLLDFVKEENLQKLVENCSCSHKQFESKVANFTKMFADVKRKVEDLLSSKVSLPIRNLELMIKEHHRFINEQKIIMQSLSKDVNTVKKLVDDCLSCQLSSSLRPHDAVSALGPMYDVHDKNHLPKMDACGRSISKLLDLCKAKKNEMNMFVHGYMQRITYTSFIIKDARLQFPVFREAMARQNGIFSDLKLVRGIGPAYRACLAEVVRRRASMKLYMGLAGQLAEKLAIKREVEVRRREEFLKVQSSYIPKDTLALMGLYDTPSQCDVNIAPFDCSLLNIDISDIDRYAPENLAGLLVKVEKSGDTKSSFYMSNESSNSVEIEENASNNFLKFDDETSFDGCELVEVAGTSKIEVENAKLKADLASKIALICYYSPEIGGSLDDNRIDNIVKNAAEKTAEALHLKDEYINHIQSMLKAKHIQCLSYEKRIEELEQRLSNRHIEGQKCVYNENESDLSNLAVKADDCKSEVLADGEAHMPYTSTTEPMDDVSYSSSFLDAKFGLLSRQHSKAREGVDENMADFSGILNPPLDSSMPELHREELQVSVRDDKDKTAQPLGMPLTHSSNEASTSEHLNIFLDGTAGEQSSVSKLSGNHVLELQTALADKSNKLHEIESKLNTVIDEVSVLEGELEISRKLLDESQMNCAHLENCLHEAREEAQTHLCAADRRASEYSALRSSAVKMRGLFERLKNCISSPGGVAVFSDSLRALAQSLANCINDNEDDVTTEFRQCVQLLSDKVGFLSRHRAELLEICSKAEVASEQHRKELDEKKELIKTLYTKHQHEKQANREKISFGHFEVHEIAAFVINSSGHYEAINRNSPDYYLSAESVALFVTDHLSSRPKYIIGQIVHIERQVVRLPPSASAMPEKTDLLTPDKRTSQLSLKTEKTSNPYGLPIGREYFIVTIAMLPDTTIRSPLPS